MAGGWDFKPSDSERMVFAAGFIVGIVLMALILGVAGALVLKSQESHWRQKAIEHNAAEYDPQTGAWRWKET